MNVMKSKSDHATLVVTDADRILIPVDLHKLTASVKKIIESRTYGALDKSFNEISAMGLHDRVRELFNVYHLANPNQDIYHSAYMGTREISDRKRPELLYLHAVFLSTRIPPSDLWDAAIVTTSTEFDRIVKASRSIRTRVLGESDELIGVIIYTEHLNEVQPNIDLNPLALPCKLVL